MVKTIPKRDFYQYFVKFGMMKKVVQHKWNWNY